MGKTTQKLKAQEVVQVAILDADGVYQGIGNVTRAQLQPGHVELPHGCDLPPGKYFWDAGRKTFMPITKREK
jgi:hypothetical protein